MFITVYFQMLKIVMELFSKRTTKKKTKHRQKVVFGGSYRVNNCRKLKQFVLKYSCIPSNTVHIIHTGKDATDFFNKTQN